MIYTSEKKEYDQINKQTSPLQCLLFFFKSYTYTLVYKLDSFTTTFLIIKCKQLLFSSLNVCYNIIIHLYI